MKKDTEQIIIHSYTEKIIHSYTEKKYIISPGQVVLSDCRNQADSN